MNSEGSFNATSLYYVFDDVNEQSDTVGIMNKLQKIFKSKEDPKDNLDLFLTRVYKYYVGKGYSNIVVKQVVNLLSVIFFLSFLIFLFSCVDYSAIRNYADDKKIMNLNGILHMNWFLVICVLVYIVFLCWKSLELLHDIVVFKHIKSFYTSKLKISDFELTTISWNHVIKRLQHLQKAGICFTEYIPLNAHHVANRIMRKENYFIAMINKDVLMMSIPLEGLRKYQFMTKFLEWNILYCVINYMFDEKMQLKKTILNDSERPAHIDELKKRFFMMGLLNLIFLPFILLYMSFHTIFKYTEYFYTKPGMLGKRQWSTLARWKFRDFNEMPHVFSERMNISTEHAQKYVSQFKYTLMNTLAKFCLFVFGSFLTALLFISLISDEALFKMEIYGKSVVWNIGFCTTICILARSFINDSTIQRPHFYMEQIVKFIHYIPNNWEKNADKREVYKNFVYLFEYQIYTVIKEIIGIVVTPFILWYSLSPTTDSIIEFVTEFTKNVNGVGLLCEFAIFDFELNGDLEYSTVSLANYNTNRKKMCKDGKLEKSYANFKINNPDWNPYEDSIIEQGRNTQVVRQPSLISSDVLFNVKNDIEKGINKNIHDTQSPIFNEENFKEEEQNEGKSVVPNFSYSNEDNDIGTESMNTMYESIITDSVFSDHTDNLEESSLLDETKIPSNMIYSLLAKKS